MLNTSYSHPVMRAHRIDKIRSNINAHIYNEELHYVEDARVVGIVANDNSVKSFYHPVLLNDEVVIDMRTYTKKDASTGGIRITNESEYKFSVMRAELELAWQGDGLYGMYNHAGIPANFYAKWVSEGLTRGYSLDPENQMRTAIVSAAYFFCQFKEEDEWDEDSYPKALSFISRSTGTPAATVQDVLPEFKLINDIDMFAELLRDTVKGDALVKLEARSLYTLLSGNWRGAHANEVAMLGVSFPPAFYSMVIAANDDRSYRNTPLQKIIDRTKKSVDTKTWTLAIRSMLVAAR